jgi:UDP-N-acetylmuramoylalanine-D-glutamate ligase
MPYEQVVSIMGSPGMVFKSKETKHLSARLTSTLYIWWTTESHPLLFITITDGKVTSTK